MTRSLVALLGAALLAAPALPLSGQSLERRIHDAAGSSRYTAVQFSFASRRGVCGDGARYLSDGLGGERRLYVEGNNQGWRRGDDWEPCAPGPVRVVVSTNDGQFTQLRTYVGPSRRAPDDAHRDLGLVSVREGIDFLTRLIEGDNGRLSNDAILPLVLADSVDPWPTLLRLERDDRLGKASRSTIAFWLARGAGYVLGVNDEEPSDDDEVRTQAVFALSQQPRESAVPRLIDIVQHSNRPVVRAQALFWLGQSGDPRAIDLFEDILRKR